MPFDYDWPVHNGRVEGRFPPLATTGSRSAMVWSVQGYDTAGKGTSEAKFDVLNCGFVLCSTFYTVKDDADYHVPMTRAGNPARGASGPGPSAARALASIALGTAPSFQPLQTRSLVEIIDENDQTEEILAEFVTTVEQLPDGEYQYV